MVNSTSFHDHARSSFLELLLVQMTGMYVSSITVIKSILYTLAVIDSRYLASYTHALHMVNPHKNTSTTVRVCLHVHTYTCDMRTHIYMIIIICCTGLASSPGPFPAFQCCTLKSGRGPGTRNHVRGLARRINCAWASQRSAVL